MHELRDLIPNAARAYAEEYMRSRARPVYLGDHRVLCRILGKLHCYVDGRDTALAPHLMLDGFWEMWVTQAVARHVKPGMTCIDVGASFGYYTLLLSELVGPDGQVQAFEPDKATANMLNASVRLNGFDGRTRVHPLAVGERDGFGQLSKPATRWSDAAVDFGATNDPSRRVSVTSLDSALAGDALSRAQTVHFVKIDAEGSEQRIWAGMQGVLERCSPVVLMEFGPGFYPDRGAGLLEAIAESGYELRHISEEGLPEQIRTDVLMDGGLDMLWLQR